MDSDFKPARRPIKSLRHDFVVLQQSPTPASNSLASETEKTATENSQNPEIVPEVLPIGKPEAFEGGKAKESWRQKLKPNWPPGKKEWLIGAGTVVFCACLTVIYLFFNPTKTAVSTAIIPTKIVKITPKPTTVPSTLSGLPVNPSVNLQPVTGVMIENSTDARPQSGLSQASVVFEAIAEGGITRFLALYQDTAPTNVGPVRSARPYYIEWAMGFDAAYAHVGGSPDALADIKSWNVRDLDEFYNGNYYHRITTRIAPHNVYTGIPTLNQLEATKGYTSSTYTGFVRKKPAPVKVPTARIINLTLSGSVYNVQYTYSPATNTYNRNEGGAPQIDANTNAQISPSVVIALVMPYSLGSLDASGAYYSVYNTIGSGSAYIFQDGTLTTGQWSKTSNSAQFTFTGSNGKTIALDPGQTWITALASTSDVTSSP